MVDGRGEVASVDEDDVEQELKHFSNLGYVHLIQYVKENKGSINDNVHSMNCEDRE